MAYADGELPDERRAALDAALAGDADLRERVTQLRAQRERVAAAFAPVLDEAVPERLRQLLAPPAPVVSLDAARAARDAQRSASRPAQWPTRVGPWAQWGGLAASLVLGVLLGLQLPRGDAPQGLAALNDGSLVATGAVASRNRSRMVTVSSGALIPPGAEAIGGHAPDPVKAPDGPARLPVAMSSTEPSLLPVLILHDPISNNPMNSAPNACSFSSRPGAPILALNPLSRRGMIR